MHSVKMNLRVPAVELMCCVWDTEPFF